MCRLIRCPPRGFDAAFCFCKDVHSDTRSMRARGVKCRMQSCSATSLLFEVFLVAFVLLVMTMLFVLLVAIGW